MTGDQEPDEVRCMQCLRLSYVSPQHRGRRLRCSRCGGMGLNVTAIPSDAGKPKWLDDEREQNRKALWRALHR
jgi:hypothetical protein